MKKLTSTLPAVLGIALCASPRLHAQDSTVHVVDDGDTLWDLAGSYLANPFRWDEIWSANRSSVADPHWIFPAQQLLIPGRGPLTSQNAAAGTPPRASGTAPGAATAVRQAPGRTVFYPRPAVSESRGPGIAYRGSVGSAARTAVTAGSYYAAPRLVPDTALFEVGRLREMAGATVIPLRTPLQIQPYDRVFMTTSADLSLGDHVQLLRRGPRVRPWGHQYTATGTARVVAMDGDVATVEIDGIFDVVAPGDIAVPLPAYRERAGVAATPASGMEGVLIAVTGDQPVVAREDLAFVNLGTASGVVEGDEFIVYIPPTEADWGRRPSIDVARVQVVRTELLTSAVRIIEMEQPAIAVGLPVRLVARMP